MVIACPRICAFRLRQAVLGDIAGAMNYNRGFIDQFLASFVQREIFLGKLVCRIVRQFCAEPVQIFASVDQFLAGIG